ncbi:MAG: HD domain-containing protein [Campylobacterota bacterium]|nr:HD domain-containing protein [Campylobacterota bacterium]
MTDTDKLQILLQLGQEISKEKSLDTALIKISQYARDLIDADRSSIFLYDSQSNELWTKVAHGIDGEIRFPSNKGVAGYAFLSQDVQVVVDAYEDFRFNKEIDKETKYQTNDILAVPLINSKNICFGVFQAINKHNGTFNSDDVKMMTLLSTLVSSALETSSLIESLEYSKRKIIYKLSSAAEFKDEDTSKHTQRVGLYCELIAKEYGLNAKEVKLLKIAAPMHDVGKIGIADKILLKPGRLDFDEFNKMKEHSQMGYDILKDDDDIQLQMAATIALEHHEKFNGYGYPRGLKGEEISIYARMTSIADVFDALTSERPYKKPWSIERTVELLKQEKNEHFDGKLVDIFLNNLDEIKRIKEKLKD